MATGSGREVAEDAGERIARNADELADDVATAGQPTFRAESPRVADEVTDFLDEVNPSRFDEALEELIEESREALAKAVDNVDDLLDEVVEELQQQADELAEGIQKQADDVTVRFEEGVKEIPDKVQGQVTVPIIQAPNSSFARRGNQILSWNEIQKYGTLADFPEGVLTNPTRYIDPTNPSLGNTSILEYIQRGDFAELGLPTKPTLQEFEAFMLDNNWAYRINDTDYPVELSGLFDHDGNLIDAAIGHTTLGNNGTYEAASINWNLFTPAQLSDATYTHSHIPGTDYFFSSADNKYVPRFAQLDVASFRAVSHDYIFQVDIPSNTRELINNLHLDVHTITPIQNATNRSIHEYQETLVGHLIYSQSDSKLASLMRQYQSNDFYQGILPPQPSVSRTATATFMESLDGSEKIGDFMASDFNQSHDIIRYVNDVNDPLVEAGGPYYQIDFEYNISVSQKGYS